MHNSVEKRINEVLVPEAAGLAQREALRKIDKALDLTRIARGDSVRNHRQLTTAAGHLSNLESLLKSIRKDLEEQNEYYRERDGAHSLLP